MIKIYGHDAAEVAAEFQRPLVKMILSLSEAEREAVLQIASLSLTLKGMVAEQEEKAPSPDRRSQAALPPPAVAETSSMIVGYAAYAPKIMEVMTERFQDIKTIHEGFKDVSNATLRSYLDRMVKSGDYPDLEAGTTKVRQANRDKLSEVLAYRRRPTPPEKRRKEREDAPVHPSDPVSSDVRPEEVPVPLAGTGKTKAERGVIEDKIVSMLVKPMCYDVGEVAKSLGVSQDQVREVAVNLEGFVTYNPTEPPSLIPEPLLTGDSILRVLRTRAGMTKHQLAEALGADAKVLETHLDYMMAQNQIRTVWGKSSLLYKVNV